MPKKTRLFVEQTQRERGAAADMHRVLQRELAKMRLATARALVKVLTDGQVGVLPASTVRALGATATPAAHGLAIAVASPRVEYVPPANWWCCQCSPRCAGHPRCCRQPGTERDRPRPGTAPAAAHQPDKRGAGACHRAAGAGAGQRRPQCAAGAHAALCCAQPGADAALHLHGKPKGCGGWGGRADREYLSQLRCRRPVPLPA